MNTIILTLILVVNVIYLIWWGRHMKKYITYLEFESEKHIIETEKRLDNITRKER
jgi:hypothetical protein